MQNQMDTEHPYLIQKPTPANNAVTAWSAQYIPYEPKGWRLAMRNEMKQAIREIRPDTQGLYAAYISENRQFCDVENVLLYNIGPSVFTNLSGSGLCFERGFGAPPALGLPLPGLGHYYHYTPGNQFRLWQKRNILAAWNRTPLPAPTGTSRPHLFWHALKTGIISAFPAENPPSTFGPDIQLAVPEGAWCNLTELVKPLLDGVISAFHQHNEVCDAEMLGRLAALTGGAPEALARALCDGRVAVLGKRRVVATYRAGIQWNPADDGCVACRFAVSRTQTAPNWTMSGDLFSVLPLH